MTYLASTPHPEARAKPSSDLPLILLLCAFVVPLALSNHRNCLISQYLANRLVESRAGALAVGSGGLSVAFATVLSPAPMATFPAPALRTGRAVFPHPALQWDHAARTRKHQDDCGPAAGDPHRRFAETARLPPSVAHRRRWEVEPVHASTTPNLSMAASRPSSSSLPSLSHVMLPGSPAVNSGL